MHAKNDSSTLDQKQCWTLAAFRHSHNPNHPLLQRGPCWPTPSFMITSALISAHTNKNYTTIYRLSLHNSQISAHHQRQQTTTTHATHHIRMPQPIPPTTCKHGKPSGRAGKNKHTRSTLPLTTAPTRPLHKNQHKHYTTTGLLSLQPLQHDRTLHNNICNSTFNTSTQTTTPGQPHPTIYTTCYTTSTTQHLALME